MRQIYDIKLTPEMVNAIKQVQEGYGVFLYDCTWYAESVSDVDKAETCFTFSDFKNAQLLKKTEEVNNEVNNEESDSE